MFNQIFRDIGGKGWAITNKLNVRYIYDGGGAFLRIDVENTTLHGEWQCTNDADSAEEVVNYRVLTNALGNVSTTNGIWRYRLDGHIVLNPDGTPDAQWTTNASGYVVLK